MAIIFEQTFRFLSEFSHWIDRDQNAWLPDAETHILFVSKDAPIIQTLTGIMSEKRNLLWF
jgi:hypothetical protein